MLRRPTSGTDCFRRNIKAIMSVNVVGSSKIIGDDEVAIVQTLAVDKNLMDALIGQQCRRVTGPEFPRQPEIRYR